MFKILVHVHVLVNVIKVMRLMNILKIPFESIIDDLVITCNKIV